MLNKNENQKRVRPANNKFVELNSGEGKAKNRRGVTFGARNAKHGADKAGSKNAVSKTSRSEKADSR
jgi:hypothetical protein